MVQRTFYPYPHEAPVDAPVWEPAPDDVHTLRHGYNLADLNMYTAMSLRRIRGGRLDYRTRFDIAWSAIAEHLYAAADDAPPEPADLIHAGWNAISGHVEQEMHHHGRDKHNGGEPMPRFAAFWEWMSLRPASPETVVVDRAALWQIWPRLSDTHRQVLGALAVHGDHRSAAAALGKTYGTFNVQLSQARRAFLALWHEGEEPSRFWGTDRRTANGGQRAVRDTARRASRAIGRRTGRARHELVHGKASTYANHGCRCEPCTTASTAKAAAARREAGVQERRRLTVSQLAEVRSRWESGETLTAIAADLGFANSYLSRLLSGKRQPAPDPA